MGFREAILKEIEKRICMALIIPDQEIEYQNDVRGYTNLYKLQFTNDGKIKKDLMQPGNLSYTDYVTSNPRPESDIGKYKSTSYLAPRIPNTGYSTPLHALYCRPIQNLDITGLRPIESRRGTTGGPNRGKVNHTPTAFLHIIDGEKDIYWPQRNRTAKARVDHQVEYMKIAIDCVFRDKCHVQKADEITGNGEHWEKEIMACRPPPPIDVTGLSLPSGYQPQYNPTINEQAVRFVQDTELILNPQTMNDIYTFGPNTASVGQPYKGQYQAWVHNTNLAMWGMLPEAGGSPTDTVRTVFELEIHYPKVPGIG